MTDTVTARSAGPSIANPSKAQRELERIQKASGLPVLLPEDVVTAAESASSPLHSFFEWDDTVAGRSYRLSQARHLIGQLMVTPSATGREVRAYVHTSATKTEPAGYRLTTEVIKSPSLSHLVIEQFDRDVRALEARNVAFTSLLTAHAATAPVIKAISTYVGKGGKTKK